MFETKQLKPGVYFGRTLRRTNRRDVKVCVANRTNRPQLITSGKCLVQPAYVTLLPSEGETIESTGTEAPASIIKSTLEKFPQYLTHQQRQQVVVNLLQDYEDVFPNVS